MQAGWQFVGNPACPVCESTKAVVRRWKYGDRCVSCERAEHYAHVSANNATVAPWWELAETCVNCDRLWS